MTPFEKNAMYHQILNIMKISETQQSAAFEITLAFEDYLNNKEDEIEEKTEEKAAGGFGGSFRRIG
jgi:hypothetical protein